MLNFIRRTLTTKSQDIPGKSGVEEERTKIAASVVLLETAHIDNECTAEELGHIIQTLRSDFKLTREQAEELVELAYHERQNAVDLFEFTNLINNAFSKEEKKAILKAAWRIIHIDGQLEKHEDHFARKLTYLLRLSHGDMIEAKLQARNEIQ